LKRPIRSNRIGRFRAGRALSAQGSGRAGASGWANSRVPNPALAMDGASHGCGGQNSRCSHASWPHALGARFFSGLWEGVSLKSSYPLYELPGKKLPFGYRPRCGK
jgi:hypothetical protein